MDPAQEHPDRQVNAPATSVRAESFLPSRSFSDHARAAVDRLAVSPAGIMDFDWSYAEGQFSPWVVEYDGASAATRAATRAAERTGELVAEQVAVERVLRQAETAQATTARSLAAEVAAATELIRLARSSPGIYLAPGGVVERDALELAERTAATDLGLRLHRSPDQVRNMAHEGRVLAEHLPQIWALFQVGRTGYAQARAAVTHLSGLTDPDVVTHYDTELAAKATELSPEAFQRKARILQQRLLDEPLELRHARSMADRRVVIEPANDGMCTVYAVVSAADGMRINARLNATAKKIAKKEAKEARAAGIGRDRCRTRAQIRTDLFTGWLAGDGTPTAAKVRPLVFVPLQGLLGGTNQAGQTIRIGQPGQPAPFDQPAVLQGYGPIDPVAAAQLFIDAPAFRRVGTDPFTGEVLTFDRTRYRPTKAQREWLAVKYGTCARTGCERLAVTSDVDHLKEWVRDHGLTNDDNLIPLCPSDHRLKTLTKIRYTRDTDGSVTVTTPSGYVGINAPPDPLPRHPRRAPLPENPPF